MSQKNLDNILPCTVQYWLEYLFWKDKKEKVFLTWILQSLIQQFIIFHINSQYFAKKKNRINFFYIKDTYMEMVFYL